MKWTEKQHEIVRDVVASQLRRSSGFHDLPAQGQATVAEDTSALAAAILAAEATDPVLAALAAVDFPAFVADLVNGTFQAVVGSSIQQMKAYAELVRSATGTLASIAKDAAGRPGASRKPLEEIRRDLGRVAKTAETSIDLPDLGDAGGAEIIADNIRAMAAIYMAALLEDLKLFAAAERVAADFVTGLIPVTQPEDSRRLIEYHRSAAQRLTEAERRNLYASTFALAPGEPRNTAFEALWLAFLAAVNALPAAAPNTPGRPQRLITVARTGHVVAVNVSQHGFGSALFAATELANLITTCLTIVRLPSVLAAYGATDGWIVVERISTQYLGGPRPIVALRTRAQSGALILRWLADHSSALSKPGTLPLAALTEQASRWLAAQIWEMGEMRNLETRTTEVM